MAIKRTGFVLALLIAVSNPSAGWPAELSDSARACILLRQRLAAGEDLAWLGHSQPAAAISTAYEALQLQADRLVEALEAGQSVESTRVYADFTLAAVNFVITAWRFGVLLPRDAVGECAKLARACVGGVTSAQAIQSQSRSTLR